MLTPLPWTWRLIRARLAALTTAQPFRLQYTRFNFTPFQRVRTGSGREGWTTDT